MATIKIKLKDTLTAPESTINLTILFTSANKNYNNMVFLATGNLRYQRTGLTTYVYRNGAYDKPECQYIEIDPTQTNFNSFITAMKSNIDGVELEAGTYKWNDSPSNILEDASGSLTGEFPFVSNGKNLSYIGVEDAGSNQVTISYTGIDFDAYVLNEIGWANYAYKTITTTENQYVDYDFYNYAFLGNQLVKQGGSGGTNKLKFGTETPTKLYMGTTEITKAYMGDVLVYEKE